MAFRSENYDQGAEIELQIRESCAVKTGYQKEAAATTEEGARSKSGGGLRLADDNSSSKFKLLERRAITLLNCECEKERDGKSLEN